MLAFTSCLWSNRVKAVQKSRRKDPLLASSGLLHYGSKINYARLRGATGYP